MIPMDAVFTRCDEDGKVHKKGALYQLQNVAWSVRGASLSTQSMATEIFNSKLDGVRRPTIGRSGNWRSVIVVPEHIAATVCIWLDNVHKDDEGKLRYMDMGLREFLLKVHGS